MSNLKIQIQAYVQVKPAGSDHYVEWYAYGVVNDSLQFDRGIEDLKDALTKGSAALLNGETSHIKTIAATFEDDYIDCSVVHVDKPSRSDGVTYDAIELNITDLRIFRAIIQDETGHSVQGRPLLGSDWSVEDKHPASCTDCDN